MNYIVFAFWKENSGGNEEDSLERKNTKDQWKTPEINLTKSMVMVRLEEFSKYLK